MKSAGMIIYGTQEGKLCAILQKRGEQNFEKGFIRNESYPGAYQITATGKCEIIDSIPTDTVHREMYEELYLNLLKESFIEGYTIRELFNDGERIIYGKNVSDELLRVIHQIRLHSSSGGIRVITKDDLDSITELRPVEDKQIGIIDRRQITMFKDEIEALKKGFHLFSMS